MKKIFILLLFQSQLIFAQNTDSLVSAQPASVKSVRLLIINAFDAGIFKNRKNKRKLIAELTDSLKSYLYQKITAVTQYEVLTIPVNYSAITNRDSLALSLMKEANAAKAVLIKELDVFFENSGERLERNAEGKNEKTIRYDMCSAAEYVIYTEYSGKREEFVRDCEFFTDRTSTGAFSFQFGPDIVGKKRHTFNAVRRNAEKFVLDDL